MSGAEKSMAKVGSGDAPRLVERSIMTQGLATGLFGILALASASVALASASLAAAPDTASAPAGNPVRGKTVFARCAVCHKVDKAAVGGMGPNLAGVYGRAAGKLPGYAYSPAMKAARLKFDEAGLSRFLAAPTKVVPGTKMMAPPLANPADRADVIAYLKTTGGGKK